MRNQIKIIGFDADDTLWINLPHFLEVEQQFCHLLNEYLPPEKASEIIFATEMKNLPLYGYGVKGFTLCLIESLIEISGGRAKLELVKKVMDLGKALLQQPVELLTGVEDTLSRLSLRYQLILITKGDLLDQERKLELSGLRDYFHHIEIISNKNSTDYLRVLKRLSCAPHEFLMLGNSLKSDVLPVLEIGGFAAHIPYSSTWQHEHCEKPAGHPCFLELKQIDDILFHLNA